MDKYNGWTNKETWLVSLWYMDDLMSYQPHSAEAIEEYIEEQIFGTHNPNGLARDLLLMCLSDTNWQELYEHTTDQRTVWRMSV